MNDKWVVLLTHDRETYNKEWTLGLALILPRSSYQGYTEARVSGKVTQSYFGKMKIEVNKPITYYAVGGWELSNPPFNSPEFFKNYVVNLAQQLTAEVEVQVR